MKRFILFTIVTLLYCSLLTNFSRASFTDVSSSNEFSDAILYVQKENIVKGYSDGSYKPSQTINRAEFTKIIVEAVVGQTPLEHAGSCFPDVTDTDWFYSYVCYAECVGWISGYPDGSFKPGNTTSFVEVAKIISKAYGYETTSDNVWYKTYVEELSTRKAIPLQIAQFDQNVTRGQMAEMIYRLNTNNQSKQSQTYESLAGQIEGPQSDQVKILIDEIPVGSLMPLNQLGNVVSMTTNSSQRIFTGNGLPNHKTGSFPNANNPNTISTQNISFKVPLNPKLSSTVTYQKLGKFGVALNGIPFDPGAAEYWNRDSNSGWQFEALGGGVNLGLDESNAHVQPNGSYHYHGIPNGLLKELKETQHSPLVGYAADGFPIYVMYGLSDPMSPQKGVRKMKTSYRVKSGTRPSGPGGSYTGIFVEDYEYVPGLGDLDECHGRYNVTPNYPEGIYSYYITDEFVYVGRCWKGTPDESFLMQGGASGNQSAGQQQGNSNQKPPQEAKEACQNKSNGTSCGFTGMRGEQVSGSCQTTSDGFLCVPSTNR